MHTLTPSQSHYIKAVYELSLGSDDGGVRVSDIAQKLELTRASASLAMSKLEREGLVHKDSRRQIRLTEEGEQHAVKMLDKYDVLWRFLTEALEVDGQTACADACAMEHVISMETLCALCRFHNRMKGRCGANCPKKMPQSLA